MDVDAREPDVQQILRSETELRPTSVRVDEPDADFCIIVAESTWNAMQTHAHTRLDAEVGGVLLGKVCRDVRETPYLLIDGHVAALEAESSASNVTFTAESWTTIHETIDRDFPGAAIVGWYHTHPAFGIFLSEMDVFIHRHFFEAPHQVAIVIDPVANTSGGFAWRAGTPAPQKLIIEPGDAAAAAPVDFRQSFLRREKQREQLGKSGVSRLARWCDSLNGRLKLVILILAFLVAFVLCCLALKAWTPLWPQTQSRWPTYVQMIGIG